MEGDRSTTDVDRAVCLLSVCRLCKDVDRAVCTLSIRRLRKDVSGIYLLSDDVPDR